MDKFVVIYKNTDSPSWKVAVDTKQGVSHEESVKIQNDLRKRKEIIAVKEITYDGCWEYIDRLNRRKDEAQYEFTDPVELRSALLASIHMDTEQLKDPNLSPFLRGFLEDRIESYRKKVNQLDGGDDITVDGEDSDITNEGAEKKPMNEADAVYYDEGNLKSCDELLAGMTDNMSEEDLDRQIAVMGKYYRILTGKRGDFKSLVAYPCPDYGFVDDNYGKVEEKTQIKLPAKWDVKAYLCKTGGHKFIEEFYLGILWLWFADREEAVRFLNELKDINLD